ncbi:MAG TPA: sugar phosphate nucleotidyltransferase [Candidatus Saccharimonadales bacterium]|nr:sugar phosphate nucleotidyltransferase [Candidatus Saccharimonadales bacterium]
MTITKAIIPVAGWGTRRLPITKAIEKCMLPIGNRPIVDYVVQDCIAAGITDIYFIIGENTSQLQSYYGDNAELNTYLVANNKESLLPLIRPLQGVTFHYIAQPSNGKYGTAIPVGLVVPDLKQDESAVVLMGDDFIYNADGSSEVARLLAGTPGGGSSLLGATIDRQHVSQYGVLALDDEGNYQEIVDRPTPESAPSSMINISKYVMNYELLAAVRAYTDIVLSGEYQITEVINQYVLRGGKVKVLEARGQYLDGGSVGGWLHANNIVVNGK